MLAVQSTACLAHQKAHAPAPSCCFALHSTHVAGQYHNMPLCQCVGVKVCCVAPGRLREAIQSAADQAGASANSSSSTGSERDRGPSAKHLKPIVTAVEMVFGSAAALSATFGYKVLPMHNKLLCLSGHRIYFLEASCWATLCVTGFQVLLDDTSGKCGTWSLLLQNGMVLIMLHARSTSKEKCKSGHMLFDCRQAF